MGKKERRSEDLISGKKRSGGLLLNKVKEEIVSVTVFDFLNSELSQTNPKMRIICKCGASFMRSGIRNHQQQSDDPRCKETGPGTFPIGDINGLEMEDIEVDQRGDVFGDYEDYSLEELGLAPVEDDEENLTHNGDSDDDDEDIIDGGVDDEGGYEISLEPDRLQNSSFSDVDDVDNSNGITQRANRLRGGAEVELKNKPYIVKVSKGKAGAVFTNHERIHGNTAYISRISNPENTFSPFSSKIEWEIAHWAKTRGPSSTAFTELMRIEGVSGVTIYLPFEANK